MEWDIEGIAENILGWMKYDESDLDTLDAYIHHDVYLALKELDPSNATRVSHLVKEKVLELWNKKD